MDFETKKIQRETLSEYLREIRQSLNVSVAEVSAKTGIKQKFIEQLESAEFQKLPPNVYVLGFLRDLATVYAIDQEALVRQFKKECTMVDPKRSRISHHESFWKSLFASMVITPKLVSLGVGFLFVLVTVGYIIYQLVAINSPPVLTIIEPKPNQVVTSSVVQVLGKTEPGTTLKINDQTIFVDSNGDFKTEVGVTSGQKELVFTASDKFNHEVRQTLGVVVNQQAVTQTAPEEALAPKVTVEFSFSGAAKIAITKDSEAAVEEDVESGTSRVVSAQRQVVFSTTNAGGASILLNGKRIGTLGRKGETIRNVIFSEESANLMVDASKKTPASN